MNNEMNFPPNFEGFVLGCIDANCSRLYRRQLLPAGWAQGGGSGSTRTSTRTARPASRCRCSRPWLRRALRRFLSFGFRFASGSAGWRCQSRTRGWRFASRSWGRGRALAGARSKTSARSALHNKSELCRLQREQKNIRRGFLSLALICF